MTEYNIYTSDKKRSEKLNFIKPRYLVPVLLLLAVVGLLIFQGKSSEELHQFFLVSMDTSVELRFTGSSKTAAEIEEKVFSEIERLEKLFSRSVGTSDVNAINNSAGLEPVPVSEEVFNLTLKAVDFARLSGGAFDPTIAPLIDLWGFFSRNYRVPAESELEDCLQVVNYRRIELDETQSTVYLPDDKMTLELGGIAKGFIVDRALQVLMDAGVKHAFINAGGDIGLLGDKPDGNPWRIGVRHPRKENSIVAIITASGGAVVTSGDYQRFFEDKGVMYHHILDPETGMPASELASVTIVAGTVTEADALSTAVFVLGPVKGLALIEELPGVEGILITSDLAIMVSTGLDARVELHP